MSILGAMLTVVVAAQTHQLTRTAPPRSAPISGFVSGGGAPLALLLAAPSGKLPPPVASASLYIRLIAHHFTTQPWDPAVPIPAGWEAVPGADAERLRQNLKVGKFVPDKRANDLTVTPSPSLSSARAEQRRQRTEARVTSRKERGAQAKAKRAARTPRTPRTPRPARTPRKARPPRPPRNGRPPRPERPRGQPKRKPVQGLCKMNDESGGCWNAGTCGPSPTGGPGVVGHCVFEASEDCAACIGGSCSKHGAGLIRKMIATLPDSWKADPAWKAEGERKAEVRKRRRRERKRVLPPGLSPTSVPAGLAPVVVPAAQGCTTQWKRTKCWPPVIMCTSGDRPPDLIVDGKAVDCGWTAV